MDPVAVQHVFSPKGRRAFVALGTVFLLALVLLASLASAFRQKPQPGSATQAAAKQLAVAENPIVPPPASPVTSSTSYEPIPIRASHGVPAPATLTETATNDTVPSSWLAAVQAEIAQAEYEITRPEGSAVPLGADAVYQAPNRAQNFRTYFTPTGIQLRPRVGAVKAWNWGRAVQFWRTPA